MMWNAWKDELLLREALLIEPYQFKSRSRERGNAWKIIAEHLNDGSTEDVFFKVDARAVRERFDLLIAQYISKLKDQEKSTGISPEETPLDTALESVVDRMKVCEEELKNQNDKENEKATKDRETAEEMRRQSMETFMETKERKKLEDGESPPLKKRRSSGSDTIQYLREKSEADRELRMQELEYQREELCVRQEQQTQMLNQMMNQNQQFFAVIAQLLKK